MRFKGMKLYCEDGQVIETSPAHLHGDLPWDAYVLRKDGSIAHWADGHSESAALMGLLKKVVELYV